MQLDTLHIVVTGGPGGLGQAVVGRLLDAGATLHLPVELASHLDGFSHAGHARLSTETDIDLTDAAAVDAYYAGLPPLWGSIHLAGGFAMAPLAETDAEAFQTMIDMNLRTCFLCCRAAAASMASGGNGGRIVNVAARPGLEPRSGGGMAAYTASKAGVAALTAALGEELASQNIWVNAVAPSIIDTPDNRNAMPDADHSAWPKPEEIAETIAFLVSPDNKVTRGGVLPVYGRF
ncbi:MAG: SDR family NAD(P)-dependent oxidoreductase [Alphaproteobacteria bacterium]|nr:SDR family NAD(P)-dependent oxidoreductase [Alphaproteobacteria bacterium]